jgi:hypothetical protein
LSSGLPEPLQKIDARIIRTSPDTSLKDKDFQEKDFLLTRHYGCAK